MSDRSNGGSAIYSLYSTVFLFRNRDRSPSPLPRSSNVNLQGKSPVTVTVHVKPDSPPRPPVKPTPPNGVLHRYVAPDVRPVGQDTRKEPGASTCSAEEQSTAPIPTPRVTTGTTTTTVDVHCEKV